MIDSPRLTVCLLIGCAAALAAARFEVSKKRMVQTVIPVSADTGAPATLDPTGSLQQGSEIHTVKPTVRDSIAGNEVIRAPTEEELRQAMKSAEIKNSAVYKRGEALRIRQKAILQYGPFLGSVSLSSSQRQRFIQLLSDQENLPEEILKNLSELAKQSASNQPGQSIAANAEFAKEALAASGTILTEEVKAVLGSGGFQKFLEYTETKPVNLLLVELRQNLAAAGTTLNESQEERFKRAVLTSTGQASSYMAVPVSVRDNAIERFENVPGRRVGPNWVEVLSGGQVVVGVNIGDDVISGARAYLTPQQQSVLNDIAERQKAGRALFEKQR